MRGSIKKRESGGYQLILFHGYDAEGKRVYLYRTVHCTKKEAEQKLRDWLNSPDKRAWLLPKPEPQKLPTLDEHLNNWLQLVATRVKRRTFHGYTGLLQRYVSPHLGPRQIDTIRLMDIQLLYQQLQQSGGKNGRALSGLVVRHVHSVLKDALDQALQWELIAVNPAAISARKILPRVDAVARQVFTREQARVFLKACRATNTKHGLIFEFALQTGMRPEEYLALQWSDIDFEKSTARVQQVLIWHERLTDKERAEGSAGWEFDEPKTKKSRRAVKLWSRSLVERLLEHRREQKKLRFKLGNAWEDHDLVFCTESPRGTPGLTTERGKYAGKTKVTPRPAEKGEIKRRQLPRKAGTPLLVQNLNTRYFQPLLQRAGLPSMRLYDLRHSFATLLLSKAVHPKIVSEILGHASIRITLDIYSHFLPTMQESLTVTIDELFADVA